MAQSPAREPEPDPRTALDVTWLGHATVVLHLGATTLVTDPVLRQRLQHLRRHGPSPAIPRDVDAVLVSHAHHDHLDLPSLRLLGPVGLVVVPRGAGRALRRVPARSVVELGAGDERQVGDVLVRAVPAVHDGRRAPRRHPSEALGFVLEHAGRRVYFAGDTELFDGLGDAVRPGRLDLALLPVWGWGPSLGPGHMDPEQAARAAALLRPRVAIPIHWGTLLPVGLHRRHARLLHEPGADFARHVARLAPDVDVRLLAAGETVQL